MTVRGLGRRGRGLAAAASAAAALWLAPARAADFLVQTQTIGQAYTLRDFGAPGENGVLNERRFTQLLGLEGWNLFVPQDGRHRGWGRWSLVISARYDADFGSYVTQPIGRLSVTEAIPTISPSSIEMLYAYLEGHDVGGFADIRLGRQVRADLMDWYALDGGDVVAHTPWHVAVEALAGLEVRGSSPIASPNFELDGTSFGHYRELPVYTYGAAIESWDLRWLTARVAYRRAFSSTSQDGYPGNPGAPYVLDPKLFDLGAIPGTGSGTNLELATLELRGSFFGGDLTPWIGVRENLLMHWADDVEGGVRLAYGGVHAFAADVVHIAPSFDGDSIFNVFPIQPYTDYRVTYDVWPGRGPVRAYLRGYLRGFTDATGTTYARGAGAGASYRARWGFVRLDGNYEDGYGGLDTGVDLAARYLASESLAAEGRLTYLVLNERNTLTNLELATQSFGMQGGGRYRFTDGLALHLLFEDNFNRFYTDEVRGVAILDFATWL